MTIIFITFSITIFTTIAGTIFKIFRNEKDYIDVDYFLKNSFILLIAVTIQLLLLGCIYKFYNENPKYKQNISYPIVSKEINREKERITYKLNFKIKKFYSYKNYNIYIIKEEYDLLNEGDKIPFFYNSETKSIKLDEKKFYELIKTLKDKEDTK